MSDMDDTRQDYSRLTNDERLRMGAQSARGKSLRKGGARASNQVRIGSTLGRILRPAYRDPQRLTFAVKTWMFPQDDDNPVQLYQEMNAFGGVDPQRSLIGFAWLETMWVELVFKGGARPYMVFTGGGPAGTNEGHLTYDVNVRLSLLNKTGDEIKWLTMTGSFNDHVKEVFSFSGSNLNETVDADGHATADPFVYDDGAEDPIPIPEFYGIQCDMTGSTHTESGTAHAHFTDLFEVRLNWLEAVPL